MSFFASTITFYDIQKNGYGIFYVAILVISL